MGWLTYSFGRVPKLVLVILRLGVSFLDLVPWAACWAACYTGYCYVLGNLLCSESSIKVAREVCDGGNRGQPEPVALAKLYWGQLCCHFLTSLT